MDWKLEDLGIILDTEKENRKVEKRKLIEEKEIIDNKSRTLELKKRSKLYKQM